MPTRFVRPAVDSFRGLLYRLEPDFTKPLLQVPPEAEARLRKRVRSKHSFRRQMCCSGPKRPKLLSSK